VLVACACGTSTKRTTASRPPASLERFVSILEHGGSLFGLDAGCSEWRAGPEVSEVIPSDAKDEVIVSDGKDKVSDGWPVEGQLSARDPDAEGRLYGFSYRLSTEPRPVRMQISGRGSWSSAPGVIIRNPDNPEMVTIGSGTYCVTEVEVHERLDDKDSVTVGNEEWFLSPDACLRSRTEASSTPRGCSDPKPQIRQ
jgi:hypothetical protein